MKELHNKQRVKLVTWQESTATVGTHPDPNAPPFTILNPPSRYDFNLATPLIPGELVIIEGHTYQVTLPPYSNPLHPNYADPIHFKEVRHV